MRSHIGPYFPATTVGALTLPAVRRWRKKLLDSGVSEVTVAKAYRLLRAILNTAVDDALIRRNPCRIKGAGTEHSPERPTLTVAQIYALADAVGSRYRVLILLITFASLRWSELAALHKEDIDLKTCTVRVTRQIVYLPGGGHSFALPKSRAGVRMVAFADLIVADLQLHLDGIDDPSALVFTSPNGAPLRHSNFYRRVWMPALKLLGLVGLHIQDLRHAGNQFTSDAGASLREMMERMGHDSTRAALIYQHSTDVRQRAIADQVSKNARAALGKRKRSAREWHARPRRHRDRTYRRPREDTDLGFRKCARQDSNPRPAA